MSAELFFIYDSHCPWSYAATELVDKIAEAYPSVKINFWHTAYFDGETGVKKQQIEDVSSLSNKHFNKSYLDSLSENRDSTLIANILAWSDLKTPQSTLPLLKAFQQAHFEEGKSLTDPDDVNDILGSLKVFPPSKTLTNAKLTKDAESVVHEVFEMQDFIETKAIPALLFAFNDNLTLINHDIYLKEPERIIEALSELGA